MVYHLKCSPNNNHVQRQRNGIRSWSLWVMDSPKFPCDTRVVTLDARLLLLPAAQGSVVQLWAQWIHEENVSRTLLRIEIVWCCVYACPAREVLNKTIYRLQAKFRDTFTVYGRRRVRRQQFYQAVHSATKIHQADGRENLREDCHSKLNYLCNSCGLDCVLNYTPYTIQPFAMYLSWSNRWLNKISYCG